MIIVVRPDATDAQIQHIVDRVQELGFQPHYSRGQHRTIIGVIGDESKLQTEVFGAIPGVEQVLAIMKPFKLASRELHAEDTVVQVGVVKIGARNMQNFDLLKEVGQAHKPILLKRGMSATVKDLLMSAEYILSAGNPNVVLCERGVRSFEDSTRNMLDMSAVPNVKGQSHLPIIVDPSHATGRPDLIPSMACASVAAGADGVHVEVHSCPEKALSDGPQALLPKQYAALMEQLRRRAEVVGRTF